MPDKKMFVASFSGGKDSVLAIYRAIKAGHVPIGLITTFDEENGRSWFHNIPKTLLELVSSSVGIPLVLVNTKGAGYAEVFENALAAFKAQGAQMCVFGDIDIKEHLIWCKSRCGNAGIDGYFPLWEGNREDIANEFIEAGFKAVITVIDPLKIDESYLGQTLSKDILEQIKATGADVCGENGEYHTFVYDGPIFERRIAFKTGEIVKTEKRSELQIQNAKE